MIENKEDLRNSGLFTIGTNIQMDVGKGRHALGQRLRIEPGEIWGIKSVSGFVSDEDAILEISAVNGKKTLETFFALLADVEIDITTEKFKGHLIGPFSNSTDIVMFVKVEEPASIFATATIERLAPPSLWVTSNVGQSGNPLQATMPMFDMSQFAPAEDRAERDVYFVADSCAKDYEEPGYHQMRDGKYHPCPTCMELLLKGDLSGGLEILQGGTTVTKIEKDVEIEVNNSKIETLAEVEVAIFQGGEIASNDVLQKMKLETAKQPGTIQCKVCGVEGSEKNPPICKTNCSKRVISDIMFSSWHKGPNGKSHYCKTCVNLNIENIEKNAQATKSA